MSFASEGLKRWIETRDDAELEALFAEPSEQLSEALGIFLFLWPNDFEALRAAVRPMLRPMADSLSTLVAVQFGVLTIDETVEAYRRYFLEWSPMQISRTLSGNLPNNQSAFGVYLSSIDIDELTSEQIALAFALATTHRDMFAARLVGMSRSDEEFIRVAKAVQPKIAGQKPAQGRKLKIAWCISGQLRGYEKAAKSWTKIGLDQHDVTTYVHVWKNVGRKLPAPGELERCFSGNLLSALIDLVIFPGWGEVRDRYKRLLGWFDDGSYVEMEYLEEFYGSRNVVIEDDSDNKFHLWANYGKMYYKIEKANDLVDGNFDLVVRVRPDKIISGKIDWNVIAERSAENDVVFVDFVEAHSPTVGLAVGDQVAMGSQFAMDIYSRTYSRWNSGDISAVEPKEMLPHTNLAYNLAMNGLKTAYPNGLVFGDLLGPPPIDAKTALDLLEADVGESLDPTDIAVLAAARADVEAAASVST